MCSNLAGITLRHEGFKGAYVLHLALFQFPSFSQSGQNKTYVAHEEKPIGEEGRCMSGRGNDIAGHEDFFRSPRTNSVQLITIQPYEIAICCQPVPFGYM